jgi:hypothetical protein
VKTNDPQRETILLVVKATVKVPIYVSTRYVHLYGSNDQPVQKTVRIKAELQKPLTLKVDEFSPKEKLKYAIETVEKGKSYNVIFSSIPGIKENFRGILKLKTNYDEKPEINLVVHARFKPRPIPPKSSPNIAPKRPPIFVSSRYVRLYGKEGAEITKSVEIRAQESKSLNLTITKFNLEDKVKYTVETVEKGRKYRIRFSTVPGKHHNFNGLLKLKTNYPEMPLITFVIHGRFAKP